MRSAVALLAALLLALMASCGAVVNHASSCCEGIFHGNESRMCRRCGAFTATCKLCPKCVNTSGDCAHCMGSPSR